MQASEQDWPVASVEAFPSESPGELRFNVHRRDGGLDQVLRRFPEAGPTEFESEAVESDLVLSSRNAEGHLISRLDLPEGKDSVAKRNPLAIRKD